MWNYFIAQRFSEYAVAGILGNVWAETGGDMKGSILVMTISYLLLSIRTVNSDMDWQLKAGFGIYREVLAEYETAWVSYDRDELQYVAFGTPMEDDRIFEICCCLYDVVGQDNEKELVVACRGPDEDIIYPLGIYSCSGEDEIKWYECLWTYDICENGLLYVCSRAYSDAEVVKTLNTQLEYYKLGYADKDRYESHGIADVEIIEPILLCEPMDDDEEDIYYRGYEEDEENRMTEEEYRNIESSHPSIMYELEWYELSEVMSMIS